MRRGCKRLVQRRPEPPARCRRRARLARDPGGSNGGSKGLNKPRRRCCNPRPRFSNGRQRPPSRRGGASTRVPDDSGERACPGTSPGRRADKPERATARRSLERPSRHARERGGATRSARSRRAAKPPNVTADPGQQARRWSKHRSWARKEDVVLLVERRARLVHAMSNRLLHGVSVLLQLPELSDQPVGVHLMDVVAVLG